jgi:hypothetical protein
MHDAVAMSDRWLRLLAMGSLAGLLAGIFIAIPATAVAHAAVPIYYQPTPFEVPAYHLPLEFRLLLAIPIAATGLAIAGLVQILDRRLPDAGKIADLDIGIWRPGRRRRHRTACSPADHGPHLDRR